jgi:hypothetical protein
MDCITVTDAKHVREYRVWLRFSTGEAGEVDLQDVISRFEVAAPLRNVTAFSKLSLNEWPTLAWDCGFDLDPEYLYELATGKPTYETQAVLR